MAKFLDKAGLERLTEHWNGRLDAKQDKLTGAPGQVVGFGEDGEAVAQDAPEGEGITIPLPVSDGGTGATTATTARANLGAASTASPVFIGSISLGRKADTTVGTNSFAVGYDTTASGHYSHAEGGSTTASGDYSHAEGYGTTASGLRAHADGNKTTASGNYSHAEGYDTTASGFGTHAEGGATTASGNYSHAEGYGTTAEYYAGTAIGRYNKEYNPSVNANYLGYFFVVGNGSSATARSNCFRVDSTQGCFGTGAWNATGADYAELFEWADGNPEAQDRAGLFVTLDGEHIRIAGPDDDYILGIVSGNPSVVGDVYDDQWVGMFLTDIFGRPLWEDVEVPEEKDDDGNVIIPAHMERRQKLNPDYDHTIKYQPRTERPEWDAVGMLGKLVARDDGTCQVNGWCMPGNGGIATASMERTRYRIIARLDESHVRVLVV